MSWNEVDPCPNGDVECQSTWLDPDEIAFRAAYCPDCQDERLPDGWRPDPERNVALLERLATLVDRIESDGDLPEETEMWLQLAHSDVETALETYHQHVREQDGIY